MGDIVGNMKNIRLQLVMVVVGFGPSELSKMIEVDKSTIQQWLRGRQSPNFGNAKRVARVLGVDAFWLFHSRLEMNVEKVLLELQRY